MTTRGAGHASAARPEPVLPLHLSYRDADHVTATIGNVLVVYSRDEPTPRLLAAAAQTSRQLASAHPGGIAVLVVIASSAGPPGEDARNEIRGVLASSKAYLRAIAYVVEGGGFAAAAKRSALSLLALVARFSFPLKVFGDVSAAGAWLRAKLGPALSDEITGDNLALAIARLRTMLTTASTGTGANPGSAGC